MTVSTLPQTPLHGCQDLPGASESFWGLLHGCCRPETAALLELCANECNGIIVKNRMEKRWRRVDFSVAVTVDVFLWIYLADVAMD